MLVSSYITPKARKGAVSAIEGRGLVAVAPISGGEVVAIKGGHIVTTAVLHALPGQLQNSEIQIADGFHLAALEDAEYEPVMLFLNHSCEPNVGFAGNTVLVAMRDISPGEELTTDYALFDDHDETMRCQCQTRSCRGTIGGRDWQRPDLQRSYGSYFSAYLLRRINRQRDRVRHVTSPGSEHLDGRHRDTVRQIFEHPASHNIEWRAVMSLLEAVGTVTVRHDGKVSVKVGPELEFLEPPAGKDIDEQTVVDLRRMLANAGYGPA